MPENLRKIALLALVVALLAEASPKPAAAHAGGIDIAFYGGFTPGATRCLRRITTAAKRCARRTYALQRRCTDLEIQGGTCERVQLGRDLDALTGEALASVERSCTGGQLTELGLISFTDARNDLLQFCLRGEDVVSAVYSAFLESDKTAEQVTCTLRAARLSSKLFSRTLQLRGDILDRVAFQVLTPKEKRKMLQRASDQLFAMRTAVGADLGESCADFSSLYGKSIETFTSGIEGLGDCALFFLYAQTAVICPF